MTEKKDIPKLTKKVKKWLENWVVGTTQQRIFRDSPHLEMEAYLESPEDFTLLGLYSSRLFFWHYCAYLQLSFDCSDEKNVELSLATSYGGAMVKFEKALVDNDKGGEIQLADAALIVSLYTIAGWQEETKKIYKVLAEGLNTPLLDLQINKRHAVGELFRHFWFLMHILSDFYGEKIDTSLYSHPTTMSPYDEVLKNWRTTNADEVQDFITQMANYHIEQTTLPSHEDWFEFDVESRMIFPYEILAFLRLREWEGLNNPETLDHPLMQCPPAQMLSSKIQKIPPTPLLDKVISKFMFEHPDKLP